MFHVEPTARALLLGAFLSAAALAQTDGGTPRPPAAGAETGLSGTADAGSAVPSGQEPPAKKAPVKKRRASTTGKPSGTGTGTGKKGKAGSPKSSAGAPGKTGAASKRDPRTAGIGRSCTKRADCVSSAHVCLRQHDQRGKLFPRGVCALPCAGLEQGLTKTRPGFPAKDPQTTKKILKVPPPPRCPARYQCRSKGGDIPIDLCVKG
jgi:hypothetical protein